MINISNLGVHFGKQVLFESVSFQLNPGSRYGVVGANGSGKSTLMKILIGEMEPEAGEVFLPADIKLGLLKQDQFKYENTPILDVVLMGRPLLWEALVEKEAISQTEHINESIGKKLADLETTIADNDGYLAEAEATELLSGLGIEPRLVSQPLSILSGGYKLRVLLAQCLFSQPDFLMLDEPTNHLDINSIQWLESYLENFKGATFVISHDEHFLNQTSTHIIDIDYETVKIYTGNYLQFQAAKVLERQQKEQEIVRQEKKKEELQQFIDRFKAKATKARQAASRSKQLDKIEDIVIKRSSRLSPGFAFDIERPSGKKVFAVKGLSKHYDDKMVLNNINFKMERDEKIAIIGPNGIGKSTLIKILTDSQKPSQGTVELGHEVKIGYFPQDHQEFLFQDTSAYEWLYSFAPWEEIGKIRGLLGRVLIQGDDVHKKLKALSGGESGRLIFSKIILQQPNLLLLDEPTNHMDIESINGLGKALQNYPGSIVCVSHNRMFIDQFATNILELKADGFELFKGSYREYLEKQGNDYLNRTQIAVQKEFDSKPKQQSNNKARKSLKKELNKLQKGVASKEKEIEDLEAKILEIDEKLGNADIYNSENQPQLQELLSLKDQHNESLTAANELWEKWQIELESIQLQNGN
jgi:ATPase subunit of ABC transporter with duplicated ATPase domains